MVIYLVYAVRNFPRFRGDFARHPLTLLLILHVFWIGVTTLTSDLQFVSVKFLLAKLWYVVTFFFLAGHILQGESDYRRFFWTLFWPQLAVVLIVLARHATYGFAFAEIHSVLWPFQRNHVNYAADLALIFPMVVLAINWYPRGSWQRRILIGTAALFFVAIYLSYTRAAYVALLIALGGYFIIRWKLMKYVLIAGVIGAVGIAGYYVNQSRYLELAPNYERTITHQDFSNLVEATYRMEDISTMERLYRWVAAGHMTPERPLFGWGPGNFVNFYESFTVLSFQTYVSDNPERSGLHSYYIMTLVEQGFPGLIIFLALIFAVLLTGQRAYHALADQPVRQRIVLIVVLSTIVIDSFNLINDIVETDKVGSFFFLFMAILVNQDLAARKTRPSTKPAKPAPGA
jgi:O-antigen ligase